MPCDRLVIQPSTKSSLFAKRLPATFSILWHRKSPSVTGPDCTEDSRSCPNGTAHAERLVSAGQYAEVHCPITEQRESLPLRQNNPRSHRPAETNDTSHLSAGGTLNRHSHGHSYLCTYHVTRSDVQLLETIFNITLNTRNQRSAATKQVRGLYAEEFFTFWMAFVYTLAVQSSTL